MAWVQLPHSPALFYLTEQIEPITLETQQRRGSMIRLNKNDTAWFNYEALPSLHVPADSSPAAELYAAAGVAGIARLHRAIKSRDINKIQRMLDELSQPR